MQVGNRIREIRASGTVTLAQKVRELVETGVDIIDLTEGQPDFSTASFVIDEAFKAAKEGQTRYTAVAGTPQLRQAISLKLLNDNSLTYHPNDIVVGTGGKQLIFNALMVSLNLGDEVIIPAPFWPSYPDVVTFAGGQPVIVTCHQSSGFKISATALEEAINTKTRWLILNSPGNPTGSVYTRTELANLADVLRRHPQVSILSDDIYEKIIYDTVSFATMAEVAPDLKDRTLVVNGVSKAYAMTGWRIGYAAGPVEFVNEMIKLQGQSTTNASSVSQAAALAALTGRQEYLREWGLIYQKRRNLVYEMLSSIDGLVPSIPEGAFYHFVQCRDFIGRSIPDGQIIESDLELANYLLTNALVAVIPGSVFGCSGYFRLCFASSQKKLSKACIQIGDALGKLH